MKTHFEEPPISFEAAEMSALEIQKKIGKEFLPTLIAAESVIRDDDISLSEKSFDNNLLNQVTDDSIVAVENDSVTDELKCLAVSASQESDSKPATSISPKSDNALFLSLRITYLIVTLVVMLADGLQGTHLYVLYEGYGFTVANLYCLGFVTGGLASPITGPLVDKLGRKKSAILYCVLEIIINRLEQYPLLAGLIISRMVGGITTNLLSTVFDTWLDTEYRRRGIQKEGGYEIIMRDSVIVSNLAAIGSGYLAHILAEFYGPKGPFEGAVMCTTMALIVIAFIWSENYGCGDDQVKEMKHFMGDAIKAFKADSKVLRLGIIQGLTCGSIQIFIFLWSPALRHFAESAPKGAIGLDHNGEPAYGLIFGAFMACGVLGGLTAPWIRQFASSMMKPSANDENCVTSQLVHDGEQTNDDRPTAVEAISSLCYFASAFLLLLPCLLDGEGEHSFSICLGAFLLYEYIVGLYLPCEGVLRSIYFPAEGRASILTLPRIIVNGAVSLGVVLTNYMTMRSAFSSIFVLMVVATGLQLSLVQSEPQQLESNSSKAKECPVFDMAGGDATPELQRASFASQCDSDDSSLSSSEGSTHSPAKKNGSGKMKSE